MKKNLHILRGYLMVSGRKNFVIYRKVFRAFGTSPVESEHHPTVMIKAIRVAFH